MNDQTCTTVSRWEFYGNLVVIGMILVTVQMKNPHTWDGLVGPLNLLATSCLLLMWGVRAHRARMREELPLPNDRSSGK